MRGLLACGTTLRSLSLSCHFDRSEAKWRNLQLLFGALPLKWRFSVLVTNHRNRETFIWTAAISPTTTAMVLVRQCGLTRTRFQVQTAGKLMSSLSDSFLTISRFDSE